MPKLPPFGTQAFTDTYIAACEYLEAATNLGTLSDCQDARRYLLRILPMIPKNKLRNYQRHLEWW